MRAPTMSHPTFRIAIGADHGAFELKQAVVAHLRAVGHEVTDFGTDSKTSVDYADYANAVARAVELAADAARRHEQAGLAKGCFVNP